MKAQAMEHYFNLDGMAPGDSVVLLVSGTIPDEKSGAWPKRTPVTVTRDESGWSYESPFGSTRAEPVPGDNSGHRGLFAHLKARGAQLFEALPERDLTRRNYRAERRKASGRARELRNGWVRFTAHESLRIARRDMAAGKVAFYVPDSIWTFTGHAGAPWNGYGEKMRWIEKPESCGLRFVGLAHDIARRMNHTGWHIDSEGWESVSGVVYQLPGKNGRARYLAGFADPFNTGKDGRGAAALSMEIFESEARAGAEDSEAREEAARRADQIAERMAEEARDHEAATNAGREARQKAAAARSTGSAWVTVLKQIKTAFAERREAVAHDVPVAATREWIRARIREARALCDSYREEIEAAREARDESKPSRRNENLFFAWLDGYQNGVD